MTTLLNHPATPILHADRTRMVHRVIFALAILAAALFGSLAGLLFVYSADLPQVTDLERYRPSSVTELYDQKGNVIGTFALQRRVIAKYEDYPKVLRDAVISIEDKDFERHWGIDLWRIMGAAYRDLVSGSRAQGASTLTMQLSRNLFLSPDRKFGRKVQEIMLAIQIERRFTKEQIFTLYANQIFLGHGVYGFEAGSEFYFNKPAKELTIEEAALLAGLPKGPSAYSPINNPEKALRRRNLVINNMMEDGRITAGQAQEAKARPLSLHLQSDPNNLAPYFIEETRRYLERRYGTDQVHEGGLRVYTSLDLELQKTATRAVLDGLAAYERRHGWKGHVRNLVAAGDDLSSYEHPDWNHTPEPGTYFHALVTAVSPAEAEIKIGKYQAQIRAPEMAWTGHRSPNEILSTGDIVYVRVTAVEPDHKLQLALEQDSGAQAALVAIDNNTGEIRAMVGGRDFDESKFNRATQALRQTGSSFKPYVYSAAVEQGALPDDTILDAPISFPSVSGTWAPHNYDGKYEGMISLRRALAASRNIPAIKLAQRVGIKTVIDYVHKFGITSEIQPYLPVAARLGRSHLARAHCGVLHLSQRRCAAESPLHSQGDRLRRTHHGGRFCRRARRHQRTFGASDGRAAARRGAARHGNCRQQAESSPGRQDGHHQRLHRCMVRRLFAVHQLWGLGRLRRKKDPGRKGNRGPRRAPNLDGFYEDRHRR